jgi:hypothetical protein
LVCFHQQPVYPVVLFQTFETKNATRSPLKQRTSLEKNCPETEKKEALSQKISDEKKRERLLAQALKKLATKKTTGDLDQRSKDVQHNYRATTM